MFVVPSTIFNNMRVHSLCSTFFHLRVFCKHVCVRVPMYVYSATLILGKQNEAGIEQQQRRRQHRRHTFKQ